MPTLQATPAPAPVAATPVVAGSQAPTANQMYEAARAHRRELVNQLERIEEQRSDLRQALTEGRPEADRVGIEARLKEVDARILSLDKEIAVADQRVAEAAAVPRATESPPRPFVPRQGPPEEAWVLGGFFIVCVLMPMSIAYARRIWRRGNTTPATMPAELGDRLNRLEQAVDAVAVELERVGEGQRYMTRAFSEGRALGAGAAEPIEVRQREAARQARP